MNIRRVRLSVTLSVGVVCVLGAFVACESASESAASSGGGAKTPAATTPAIAIKPPPVDDWTSFAKTMQPFFAENCASCHGDTDPEAGIRLTAFADKESLEKKKHVLTRALNMIRTHKMPPSDQKQPTQEELKPVLAWLDDFATRVEAADLKNPGHVTMRRLNRAEYNNTIRDLLGIEFRPADAFPEDDAGYGFDNNGDVLSLAPILMDKYLTAAETALDRALVVEPAPAVVKSFDAGPLEGTTPKGQAIVAGQGNNNVGGNNPRGRVFPYNGEIHVEYDFPKTGQYVFRVRGYGTQGTVERVRPAVLFKLDGVEVDKPITVAADFAQTAVFSNNTPVRVTAGRHVISAEFINGPGQLESEIAEAQATAVAEKIAALDAAEAGPQVAAAPGNGRGGNFGNGGQGRGGRGGAPQGSATGKPTLGIVLVEAEGPIDVTLDRMPEQFSKVFTVLPSDSVTKEVAAKQIISGFATRAFRRPVTEAEMQRLMAYWTEIDNSGEEFNRGIVLALQPVLASPKFLYRAEGEPSASDPNGVRTLNEYELASRLSYFIWSSMPDDELMALAKDGKLRANLESQVKRMLASPKSGALAENFAGQWLQTRKIPGLLPDTQKFPNFDEALRSAMLKETQLFFNSILQEDLSVLTFLDADFTFVNERLAKHYGMSDVLGEDFRRVSLTGSKRGGLLTQASVLTLTSFPTRTSPVLRGKWVLENLLDSAPPPPPPNVPKLEDHKEEVQKLTLREQMEEHRKNPTCYSCHAAMDPIGFGLENFDAIGAWRDKDGDNATLDVSGKLPDGKEFNGPAGLKQILMDRKEEFAQTLVERMMTYAMGRGMEQADRPRIRQIAAALKDKNYKFSALVMQIVQSDPFQKQGVKRGEE